MTLRTLVRCKNFYETGAIPLDAELRIVSKQFVGFRAGNSESLDLC